MMKENSYFELLSPAGSYESMIAAVNAGADAVYGGGGSFNARIGAENFTNEKLADAIDYCHARGVSFYVTLNTLISDREMENAASYISFLNEAGADALILQDIGMASLVREIAPKMPIHASTQMSVFDTAGVLQTEKLGFSRTVLARELSMDAISKIAEESNIELEVFVHGALCVCYSGQCLMSSFIGGRSGNRGRCAQPCRLPYYVNNKKGFYLSPKDLCLVNHLDELKKAGVKSFKIEGRMKGPEYVGEVTSVYRKYLDKGGKAEENDYKRLEKIFFRGGFTDGYFADKKGADMLCYEKPDNPYQKQSGSVEKPADKKTKVNISAIVCEGKPLEIKINGFGIEVNVKSTMPLESAISVVADEEKIKKQLLKLGQTPFYASDAEVKIFGNPAVPVSVINEVRREAAKELEEQIIKSFKRESNTKIIKTDTKRERTKKLKTTISVTTGEQLKAALLSDCDCIWVPYKMAEGISDERVFAYLPRMTTVSPEEILIKRVVATNIGQITPFVSAGFTVKTSGALNVFNSYSAKETAKMGVSEITLSPELNCSQIKGIDSPVPVSVFAYGRMPLMITELCLKKAAAGCKKTSVITDRTGTEFPVICAEGCKNEILNSCPVVMSDKLNDIKESGADSVIISLTVENYKESRKILDMYKKGEKADFEFTRGKFYKSV